VVILTYIKNLYLKCEANTADNIALGKYVFKGVFNMEKSDIDGLKNPALGSSDKVTIKTGVSTYSFTQAWVENKALNDILVGMIVEDYTPHNNDN